MEQGGGGKRNAGRWIIRSSQRQSERTGRRKKKRGGRFDKEEKIMEKEGTRPQL